MEAVCSYKNFGVYIKVHKALQPMGCSEHLQSCENLRSQYLSFCTCQERLWAALASGELDMVVSDHSPCTPELKQMEEEKGNFLSAWGGISSLQFGMYIKFPTYMFQEINQGKAPHKE
jgi:hypothetical protein